MHPWLPPTAFSQFPFSDRMGAKVNGLPSSNSLHWVWTFSIMAAISAMKILTTTFSKGLTVARVASLVTSGPGLVASSSLAKTAAAAVVGGAIAVGAVPVAVSCLGFTTTGIAASSLAAKMMSISAIANGGGVAAGSLVATLQSVGASGLSIASNIILGSVGSRLGMWVVGL
ncbi:interferon alpha-inducible protein 27-like protein 1 [Suncus etruscus]|uniref:interferon alpha-inducible protein 27-like protein 1 n=1 Tax=Suncus etruscus TaxID=109475 RepID=UPI00210FDAB8|nr:interferon alpha-inducible protein 27-like protein 1 [Suncus etruscus]